MGKFLILIFFFKKALGLGGAIPQAPEWLCPYIYIIKLSLN
jgi:hypothetical protein